MIAIRPATAADAPAVAAIYAWHVAHGVATFDIEAPGADSHAARIAECTAAGWPYLVAVADADVLGYAYAVQFRPRAAYRHTAEDSIYIRHDRRGAGIGRRLLGALLAASAAAGFRQMIAATGGPEPASLGLHRALGFREVGRLDAVGYKFGRWLDVVYLQRAIAETEAGGGSSGT